MRDFDSDSEKKAFPRGDRPGRTPTPHVPYSDTKVSPFTSKNQIDLMLAGYGITKTMWDFDPQNFKIELNFEAEAEIDGVKKRLQFQLRPPLFVKERITYDPVMGKHTRTRAPNIAQSMRFFHDYLKVKLLGVFAGFNPIEKEFLAEVVVRGPSGESIRLGDALEGAVKSGQLSLPESRHERVINAEAQAES